MEVHLAPELQAQFDRIVKETGLTPDELIADALAYYVPGLDQTREMLDSRYDELKSGKVMPVAGEAFFEDLRKREEQLLNQK
jgi:hypothetical protein